MLTIWLKGEVYMDISTLISDFLKQNIQSEAEVRSKLIVPFLELLGYPSELRAEEFPVYGYEGGKELRAKVADYLQFTSNEFAMNRGKSEKELTWVYNHSLLVFEAKKPTEEILVKGQPIFYSAWTRSIAYIISNGVYMEGYIVNANYSDSRIFSCLVQEIPEKWEKINLLNYHNILERKNGADKRDVWVNRDNYEDYKNIMRVRCANELYACIDRDLREFEYNLISKKNGKKSKYTALLEIRNCLITSEPGGGKSYLMWMLLREYLQKYSREQEKIPILLEGRYFGKSYQSIEEGIYTELVVSTRFVTKELIKRHLNEGGFIILLDGLDEVEYQYDTLIFELHRLRRDTDNVIVVTSRSENYNGDFSKEYNHYSLEKLSDKQVLALLNNYSNTKTYIDIHNIPKQLLEIIRTPLFLKIFVMISGKEGAYEIPANRARLFELYISEKVKQLHCSRFEENIIRMILGEYAVLSFEYGDSTNDFFDILNRISGNYDNNKIYDLIWKMGIFTEGLQGLKFFHKAMQEYFFGVHLSFMENNSLKKWLDSYVQHDQYSEVICYLSGIISNQQKETLLLDYLECHNLKLYIKALKSRRIYDFDEEKDFNFRFANRYFEQILKTYNTIISLHFSNISGSFDGYTYKSDISKKICIKGTLDFSNKLIVLQIFCGNSASKQIDVKISRISKSSMICNNISIPIDSSVLSVANMHTRQYNLNYFSHDFDSSREIAVDIVKRQLRDAMQSQVVFDTQVNVLLIERIEKELKKLRNMNLNKNKVSTLSLYSKNITDIINDLEKLCSKNQTEDLVLTLCRILVYQNVNIRDFLDVPPDIMPRKGELSYYYHELYSDNQLLEKVKKILYLSENAIKIITSNIIPILSSVKKNTRVVGVVYRENSEAGVDYIRIKIEPGEIDAPILGFRKKGINIFAEDLDEYLLNKLEFLGKSEAEIVGGQSSSLMMYFGDDVFHKLIYDCIKEMLKKIFGDLK